MVVDNDVLGKAEYLPLSSKLFLMPAMLTYKGKTAFNSHTHIHIHMQDRLNNKSNGFDFIIHFHSSSECV